jgi:hypothetical protein
MVLDIAFQGQAPIPRLGSVQQIRDYAGPRGWLRKIPAVGDLYLYVNALGHAHHIGFVTQVEPLRGIAGNTSEDGKSSNGDGVYEHEVKTETFIHYPTQP